MSPIRLGALLACLWLPTLARAQAPVTIVSPFGGGSVADNGARLLAAEFTPALGMPFVVKDTTGAAGTLAAREVIRARPDGQTLLFTPLGPVVIQPSFLANAGYGPGDLAPICQLNEAPMVMMTPRNSGLRTLADVIARARAQHGAMPYGSTGPGTLPHISMVTFARLAGIELTHVSYRGPGDVMVAFQTGDVALMNDLPNSIRANDLHAITTLAPERYPDLLETQTFRELGYDLSMSNWHGLFAPTGTPQPVIARLEAACAAAARSPGVLQGHERMQLPVVFRGTEAFTAVVARDGVAMRRMIEEGHLRQVE